METRAFLFELQAAHAGRRIDKVFDNNSGRWRINEMWMY